MKIYQKNNKKMQKNKPKYAQKYAKYAISGNMLKYAILGGKRTKYKIDAKICNAWN